MRGVAGIGGNGYSEEGGEEDSGKGARKEMGWEKAETLMNSLAPGGSGDRWMQAGVGWGGMGWGWGEETRRAQHGPVSGVWDGMGDKDIGILPSLGIMVS